MNTNDDMIAAMHERELKKVFSDGGNKLVNIYIHVIGD